MDDWILAAIEWRTVAAAIRGNEATGITQPWCIRCKYNCGVYVHERVYADAFVLRVLCTISMWYDKKEVGGNSLSGQNNLLMLMCLDDVALLSAWGFLPSLELFTTSGFLLIVMLFKKSKVVLSLIFSSPTCWCWWVVFFRLVKNWALNLDTIERFIESLRDFNSSSLLPCSICFPSWMKSRLSPYYCYCMHNI